MGIEQTAQVRALLAQNALLKEQVAALSKEVAELKAKLETELRKKHELPSL